MQIRLARPEDRDAIWRILEPTIRAGTSYALPPDMGEEEALDYWLGPQHDTFVAEEAGAIIGTYYLRPNHLGGGSHVANCGYITAPGASGGNVARRMCEHSLDEARKQGFRAMQFNFVVATNQQAVRLSHSLGFETVGRLPHAFLHPSHGYTDAYVMFRAL